MFFFLRHFFFLCLFLLTVLLHSSDALITCIALCGVKTD